MCGPCLWMFFMHFFNFYHIARTRRCMASQSCHHIRHIWTLCFWDIFEFFAYIEIFKYILKRGKNRLLRFSWAVRSTLSAPASGSRNPGKMGGAPENGCRTLNWKGSKSAQMGRCTVGTTQLRSENWRNTCRCNRPTV